MTEPEIIIEWDLEDIKRFKLTNEDLALISKLVRLNAVPIYRLVKHYRHFKRSAPGFDIGMWIWMEYGSAMDEAMGPLEHKLDDGLTVQLWEDRDRTKVIICPYLSCYTLGYLRFRNSRIKTVSLAEEHEDKESYLKAYAMWKGGHA